MSGKKIVYFNTADHTTGDMALDEICDSLLASAFDGDIDSKPVVLCSRDFEVNDDNAYIVYAESVREACEYIDLQASDFVEELSSLTGSRIYKDMLAEAIEGCDLVYQNDEEKQASLPASIEEWIDCWDSDERREWYEVHDPACWTSSYNTAWEEWYGAASVNDYFDAWEFCTPSESYALSGRLKGYPTEFGVYTPRMIELGFWDNENIQAGIKARFGIELDEQLNDEVYLLSNESGSKSYVFVDEGMFADVLIGDEFGQLICELIESGNDLDCISRLFADDDFDVVLDNIETYQAGVPLSDIFA